MPSLNKVILIGNITRDLELKQTSNGVNSLQFSIGVQRKFRSADGTYESDFINIVAWRQTAEFISKFFHKGSAICICGSLQTRSWTSNDNVKHYVTEVLAEEATFVEKKSESGDGFRTPAFTNGDVNAPKFEEVPADGDLPF